ncbi:hypothetical protein HRI_000221600 [Hibiscus trionum]|uniref:BZIP domain-containing protein n=1 Tax=Hibiscus trionum TaxID=183268 RepID=A0A9W7LHY1_HIBTR|nr:hypothetical protein HRI_000221600 [Hibiscus trionum]
MPTMANFISTTTTNDANHQNHHQQQPSWADEFLDFSSTRRRAHRRSISVDSIAFLDQPLEEQTRVVNAMLMEPNMFDGLDDEQLKAMLADDITLTLPPMMTVSSSSPLTPPTSNQNSNNNEKPTTTGEVESSCKVPETLPPEPPSTSNGGDPILDPKRVKRILANRQSAQKSRVRKLQYISELERSVTKLQTEVSALSPRVTFLDRQRLMLTVENSALKQRIAALAQDKIFKDAHQEALKKEIERLARIYQHQQSLKKMNGDHPPLLPLPQLEGMDHFICEHDIVENLPAYYKGRLCIDD